MSKDISPTWIVLLESIFWIIQVLFLIFAMSQDSIMVRFSMSVSDHINFFKLPISCPKYIFRESKFSRVFIFPSGPSASFANCQLTSVDSACLNTQFWFTACRCRHRRRFRRSRCIGLAASTDAAIIHSTAAILVVRSRC